ncbi:craniofacial development protein 2-like [Danaus plexippus]|uniref:craniofacial development protein 2-like n=1 Tax=Danaus plexippus TaxID=13037 RepID=UPI002AB164F7|nr:craniofacial development protein 2-like [Danaus plexippus]
MLRPKLQILSLSKVHRNGFGELRTSEGLTFLYSGKEDEEGVRKNGVRFLLSDAAKKHLLDWKSNSERIITTRFNSKARKIPVVHGYVPKNLASEHKDDFYSALNLTLKNIRKQDIVFVMGDLNAKIGTENVGSQRHMGTHRLGLRNDNEERILEFCHENDLTIGGTLFIHGDNHNAHYDRRVWADNVANCAQRAADSGNLREIYKALKILTAHRALKKKPLKDKRGELIVTSKGQFQH